MKKDGISRRVECKIDEIIAYQAAEQVDVDALGGVGLKKKIKYSDITQSVSELICYGQRDRSFLSRGLSYHFLMRNYMFKCMQLVMFRRISLDAEWQILTDLDLSIAFYFADTEGSIIHFRLIFIQFLVLNVLDISHVYSQGFP